MKLLHTSDWHLGKRLDNYSRREEQEAVLQEICDIADRENVDAVLIAGDLYDTFNPATEATELFYRYTKRLSNNGKRPVIAIAGNHDSPERIEAPEPLARECGIILSGLPKSEIAPFSLENGLQIMRSEPGFIELKLPHADVPLRLLLTPYANELRIKTFLGVGDAETEMRDLLQLFWADIARKYCDDKGVNILITHLFMVKKGEPLPEEPEEEKPILFVGGAQAIYTQNIPTEIQYVALGHLHRCQTMDVVPCPVMYAGSPIAYSFAEANQDKFAVLVDVEPGGKATTTKIPLHAGRKLLRNRFDNIDDAVVWLTDNPTAFVELTMASDTFLSAEDKKRLYDAHDSIVTIIPEMLHTDAESRDAKTAIDLTKNMDALFADFYQSKKGQAPNQRIVDLFNEILGN